MLQFQDHSVTQGSESNEDPSSQQFPSQSQSSYIPSSQSSKSKDSDMLEDSVIDGNIDGSTVPTSDKNLSESEDFSGAAVLVMWTSLLQLLSKCRRQGCGAAVLSDNMRTVRNGKCNNY